MPYIKQKDRPRLDAIIDQLPELTEGEMNYIFSRLAHRYVEDNGLCYKVLNAVVGVFHCCLSEFIRVVVSSYEDKKIQENGTVSDLDM